MHELSIAQSIRDAAVCQMQHAGGTTIDTIELSIGVFSGINLEALDFVWPLAVKGSPLEQAVRTIHVIEGEALCPECGLNFAPIQFFDACPQCGNPFTILSHGKEMTIKSLTIH